MASYHPTDVLLAVKVDDGELVKAWLEASPHADPNLRDGTAKHSTILHWASYLGLADIVSLLLEHGADANAVESDGKTPLHWAGFEGYVPVINLLVRGGADVAPADALGHRPSDLAVMQRHEEAARRLRDLMQLAAAAKPAPKSEPVPAIPEVGQLDQESTPASKQGSRALASPPSGPTALFIPRSLSPVAKGSVPTDTWPHAIDSSITTHEGGEEMLESEQDQAELRRRAYLQRLRAEQQREEEGADLSMSPTTPPPKPIVEPLRRTHAAPPPRLVDSLSPLTPTPVRSEANPVSPEASIPNRAAMELVEKHERHQFGAEFAETVEAELEQARAESAAAERQAIEREQRRLAKLEAKLARQEERRQRRTAWLEQVMRLAAVAHDIPRAQYTAMMREVAEQFHAASDARGSHKSSANDGASQTSTDSHPFDEGGSSVGNEGNAGPSVERPTLAHWRTQLAQQARGSSRPQSARPSSTRSRTDEPPPTGGRIRIPSTRFEPDLEPYIPRTARSSAPMSARSGSSLRDKSASRDEHSRWRPPASQFIEPLANQACQVTAIRPGHADRPFMVTPKVGKAAM